MRTLALAVVNAAAWVGDRLLRTTFAERRITAWPNQTHYPTKDER